jgi:type IV fimbrial biogenesis protein FimT
MLKKLSCKHELIVAERPKARNGEVRLRASLAFASTNVLRDKDFFAHGGRTRTAGFTLIELMIALVVTVILVIVAIPSFNRLILSNKLTTTANDMVAAINSARIEAVKRNATTQFCASTASANATGTSDALGTACTTQTGAVFLLPGAAAKPVQVLAAVGGLTSPLQLAGGASVALRFNGQGLAQQVSTTGTTTLFGNGASNIVMDICTSSISTDNHRQIIMVAGSTLQTKLSSGACP